MGQFTFHGQQIYEDLVRNEKDILSKEFVGNLCGEGQIIQSNESIADDEEIDNFLTEEEDYSIMDADESQLRAIRSVVNGKHMVIHGPPGTGKSQTIANLISNLLARGKKILFVCEKQVALDVVYNRLKTKGADISDLCLPLFQYTADKKFFAKSIMESRDRVISALRKVSKDSINEKLAQRERKMETLNKYAEALLSVWEPINKTVYWIHGELARVLPNTSGLSFPWNDLKNHDDIDFNAYQKINRVLVDLTEYRDLIFDTNNHWKEVKQNSFSPDYSARLITKLIELRKLIEEFPQFDLDIFGKINTINEFGSILELASKNQIDDILDNKFINSDTFDEISLKAELDSSFQIKKILDKYKGISKGKKINTIENWDKTDLAYCLLDESILTSRLFTIRNDINYIGEKLASLEASVKGNKQSSSLFNLTGVSLIKYKGLFNTDPIVQKIKNWDDRIKLYGIKNKLENIRNIYSSLTDAQEVLNEWVINTEEIDPKQIWDIEQRFSVKYRVLLKYLYPSYKEDLRVIAAWCSAHRPQTFLEYKKIIFAAADKLRLQAKYNRLIEEFIGDYFVDNSIKDISIISFCDSVEEIITYLESANIDKLNPEIRKLVSDTENFDSFNQITSLFEDLSDQKNLFNEISGREIITDNLILCDFIKQTKQIVTEFNTLMSCLDRYSLFTDRPFNIKELVEGISTLNQLKEVYGELNGYDLKRWIGVLNLEELLGAEERINHQQNQIRDVLAILGTRELTKEDFYRSLSVISEKIDSWLDWNEKYKAIKTELGVLMANDHVFQSFEVVDLEDYLSTINKMVTDKSGMERWIKFQRNLSNLYDYGVGWIIEDIQKRDIKEINFSDIFTWSFLNRLLVDIYENDEVLKNFDISDYERYLEEFRRLEKEVFEANQYRVLAKVFPHIKYAMDLGGKSERTLISESQKIKRHKPIRKLVTENAGHLLNYKPCWMMSPLTLSSYIPYGIVDFDVVIFDEASQMKIEDAIGAISRAKQVVVIGDEHQLPPTSFFDLDTDGEIEDEEEMGDVGYESILQAAITILPGAQAELLYHYRSTSDDLIAFSNHHIYGDRLITFPAPRYKNDAVKFVYVENGLYDTGQSRQNKIEATRVATLCVEHVQSNPDSLGIIAFSKAQEEAIRDSINLKIKDYPELADKFDELSDKKDCFFIKNLESVQGDQRDKIILSVGYGPDQNGNVYNRFGPINTKGGYRRLNVAITRAKNEVVCVSSIKFHDITPSESSRGACLLQRYLEYAEKGRCTLEASKILQNGKQEADSDFEISVQRALESLGYVIHRQKEAAGYSIDLAVVNPDNQNEYVLGIECDGAAYHSSKSARIRDRMRQQILERLGWKIYRVWSQHWITHSGEIVDDIVKLINKYQ